MRPIGTAPRLSMMRTLLGDMSLILGARGSTRAAFTIHGVTAVLMIVAAIPLITGLA